MPSEVNAMGNLHGISPSDEPRERPGEGDVEEERADGGQAESRETACSGGRGGKIVHK